MTEEQLAEIARITEAIEQVKELLPDIRTIQKLSIKVDKVCTRLQAVPHRLPRAV